MTDRRKQLGAEGERVAAAFLQRKGCVITESNVRTRWGEMDLIARQDDTLVFCEVRTVASGSLSKAAESVDGEKQRRLIRLADAYLQQKSPGETLSCRFDVVLLRKEQGRWAIEWIVDAFRPGW